MVSNVDNEADKNPQKIGIYNKRLSHSSKYTIPTFPWIGLFPIESTKIHLYF